MGLINRLLFSIITCMYKKPWQDCKCFTMSVADELSWDCQLSKWMLGKQPILFDKVWTLEAQVDTGTYLPFHRLLKNSWHSSTSDTMRRAPDSFPANQLNFELVGPVDCTFAWPIHLCYSH